MRQILDMDAADVASLPSMWRHTTALLRFCWRVVKRFVEDRCIQRASALGYATLLAIVPMLVLGFSVFSGFQVFEDYSTKVTGWMLQYMVPTSQGVVEDYFSSVTNKTGALSIFGIIGLLVTVTALLNTVEEAFNDIWRVTIPRPLLSKFFIFWSLLTLSPILIGASISITSYFTALPLIRDVAEGASSIQNVPFLLPWLISTAAMTTLYKLLPNTNVSFFGAIIGGAVAGVLFETSKLAFTFYVTEMANYEKLYGALGTLPVFLLWLYLVWVVVLIGAEVAFCLQNPEKSKRHGSWLLRPGIRHFYKHLILLRAAQAFRQGKNINVQIIADETNISTNTLEQWFNELQQHHLLQKLAEPPNAWVPARDPGMLSLQDVHHSLVKPSIEVPEAYVDTVLGRTLGGLHFRMQREQNDFLGEVNLLDLMQKELDYDQGQSEQKDLSTMAEK